MKKLITSALMLFILVNIAKAQLTIYSDTQSQGTNAACSQFTIYVGNNIPGSLNNNIKSIKLLKGYMATVAANEDGTGYGFNYVAATSDISVDLFYKLQGKVSFIRVLPIINPNKKGACTKDNAKAAALKSGWFYDWGNSDITIPYREYVPMSFNKGPATNPVKIAEFQAKTETNCLLGFNEPDNPEQGNVAVDTAIRYYKNLLKTGLRMGSPATEEQNYGTNKWLGDFMDGVTVDTTRVDFIAIHWYDWGSWSANQNTTPTGAQVLTRFKNYINNVYALYKRPIWITEFNSNKNTTLETHVAFMQLALPYLESDARVERYAYFFPQLLPPVDGNGVLTAMGQTYSDHVSSPSFAANIIDTRPTAAPPGSDEKVFNGNFEQTSVSAPIFPGWSFSAAADFVIQTGANAINITSVRFTSPSNERFMTSDAIEVTPGFTYTFKFTARIQAAVGPTGSAAPAQGGVFSGTILKGDGTATTFTALTTTSPNNNTLNANYTVPAGLTSISLRFRKTADIAYLDDVSLKAVPAGTLPITLLSFNGKAVDNGVELNWVTNSEINNESFTLYNSDNGKDFNKIITLKGAGNSTETKNYSFLDKNPFNGTNYYKLSQTDFDGKTTEFEPIAIDFALQAKESGIKVFSNQSDTKLELNWSLNETVVVNIFDLSGRKVFEKNLNLNNGLNNVVLNTTTTLTPNNIYVLTLKGAQKNNAVKFYTNNL